VGATDRFPIVDVHDVDAGADDVLHARPGLRERRLDVAEDLHRLCVRVVRADDRAVGADRGGAGDVDGRADAHGARVADDRLPSRAARDVPASRHAGGSTEGATVMVGPRAAVAV